MRASLRLGSVLVRDQLDPVSTWIAAVHTRSPTARTESACRSGLQGHVLRQEPSDVLVGCARRTKGKVASANLIEGRWAARRRATGPGTVDVDLLATESVRPGAERIRCALRVLHNLGTEHAGVEVVARLPVIDVDHGVVKLGAVHGEQIARLGRLPPARSPLQNTGARDRQLWSLRFGHRDWIARPECAAIEVADGG
jgi:hypothetical protein